MITLDKVGYTYPSRPAEPVFDSLNLQLGAGAGLLVAGPSGVGKSTLLRLFNGLVPHFHGGRMWGHVRVAGANPVALGPRGMSRHVGFVVQDPEDHFVTTRVEDELAFGMENHAVPRPEMARRIEEVLQRLDIVHLRRRRIETLSGGEQQRVAMAGVLVLEPDVLVLDEPTSQLDPLTAREVVQCLDGLRCGGTTLVLAEHRLQRVRSLADRLLRLPEGETVEAASTLGSPMGQLLEGLAKGSNGDLAASARDALLLSPGQDLPKHAVIQTLRRRLQEAAAGRPAEAARRSGEAEKVPDAVLEVENLGVTYGRHEALSEVSWSLPRGASVALLGRNGAGKSTLLAALLGMTKTTTGRVHWQLGRQELDPSRHGLRQLAQHVALVPQQVARLMFHETVDAELAFSLRGRDGGKELAEDLLRRYGLDHRRTAYPRDLSSGERLRLGLALMTCTSPEVLLLDEPTRGLDDLARQRFVQHLDELKAGGTSVVLATHDVDLVAAVADRVIMLDGGRVVAQGPTTEVLQQFPAWQPELMQYLGDARWTPASVLKALGEMDE